GRPSLDRFDFRCADTGILEVQPSHGLRKQFPCMRSFEHRGQTNINIESTEIGDDRESLPSLDLGHGELWRQWERKGHLRREICLLQRLHQMQCTDDCVYDAGFRGSRVCGLPVNPGLRPMKAATSDDNAVLSGITDHCGLDLDVLSSEERSVGKECRSRW